MTSDSAATNNRLGLVGAALQATLAVTLGIIANRPDAFLAPPEPIARGGALALLYMVPAVVGALGATRGRPVLLGAAAVLSSVGSVLAFSGITLIFLAPALVFAVAAGADPSASTPVRKPLWLTLAVLGLGVPATILLALRLGIFTLPLLVVLLAMLQVVRRESRRPAPPAARLSAFVLAVGIVATGIGAGWALLSFTETRCWEAERTSTGIVYRDVPDPGPGPMHLGSEVIAAGCDSGVLTVRGAATAGLLGLSAIAMAAVATIRPIHRRQTAG